MNKNIYTIYGEESFLIQRYINKLIKSNDIEITRYDMSYDSIESVFEEIMMNSMFSNSKIVICENCTFLTSNNKSSVNVDVVSKMLDTIIDCKLIFTVNSSLDERKKIVKDIHKKTNTVEFKKLKDNEVINFVMDEFKSNKYNINYNTSKYFVSIVGNELGVINNEIEKMILFKSEDYEISEKDVDSISSVFIKDNIFDLVNAIINKDLDTALLLYDDLITMGGEVIVLIAMLANQFRLIYQTKSMYKMGYSEKDIATMLDINPYRIRLANSAFLGEGASLIYLDKLSSLDIDIKSGNIDKNSGFKKFLIESL